MEIDWTDTHAKTELLSGSNTWSVVSDFPFGAEYLQICSYLSFEQEIFHQASSISRYSIVAYEEKFWILSFVFAAFDTITKEWKKFGEFNTYRHGHAVIENEGEFIVIGGNTYGERVKQCTLDNESIQCKLVEPELNSDWLYPELMLVPSDYCPE